MKTYQTVLVDDNISDCDELIRYVSRAPLLTLAKVFNHPTPALVYLADRPTDLLFLDVHLPTQSGFDLLRALVTPPVVILTTLSLTNALDAYELGIADYLVKPFSFERFQRGINRALPHLKARALPASDMVMLKEGHQSVRIPLDAIQYVEAYGSFSRVYLNDRIVLVSHLLVDMVQRLPTLHFVRVHRSYIVAVAKVNAVSAGSLNVGDRLIPVGDAYKADIKNRFIR